MKPAETIHNLFENSTLTIDPAVDKVILDKALEALPEASSAGHNRWRLIMHSKITKTAIAAGVILIVYWLMLSDKGVTEAYAITQTIEAIKTVTSVHFKAELYKQGNIECWMLFDPPHRKPTHVCLYMPSFPIRKIDSPNGSFAYNEATNRYRVNRRDERNAHWYPDFANFFEESLKKAKKSDAVTIAEEFDDELQKQVIVISVDEGDRQCRYLIDSQTKLPIRFTSTETTHLMKWMRQTIAVKNMSLIEYNLPDPEGLFDIPADAEQVTEEIDVMVRPGCGMEVGSFTHQQACEKLANEFVAAVAEFDFEKAKSLYFPLMVPPPEKLAIMKLAKKAAGDKPLIEILELGDAYESGPYWFLPCKVRELGGNIKNDPLRIRFYELDGNQYCIIAMPD